MTTRSPRHFPLLLLAVTLVVSCTKKDSPTDPGPGTTPGPISVSAPVRASLAPSPANAGAAPIDRIEVELITLPDSAALGTISATADPNGSLWNVTVTGSVPAATTSLEIAAFVRLIATSGSTQTTEFSGYVGPLQITPGGTIPPIDVPLVRGPIENFFVTGVSIDQVPDTLFEGASDAVTASATSSRAGEPVLFWSVLDTTVLAYDAGVVTARIAGNARLVATAGFFSDTTSIVVVETPGVDVAVTKAVDEATPLPGDAVTFTVEVTNNGPGPVTDIRVLDVLSSDFTAAAHVVSAGTLEGDTLWLLPALDEGARETWTTTTTVAGSAAGGSATNAATLISVAANDTTPANDSASVSMSFPLSLLPTVTITAPADSAIFDPADLITFTATASDPEDGDLSAGITWASNLNGDLGTGASVASDALDTGVHLITATVTDSDGGLRTDSLLITVALYSIPATLNVPFGNSASLPITLSEPAPVGGVTLTVLSDNATITEAQQPSVFIPGGALAANATLLGLTPGETTVTVSNPQYGAFAADVSVTAALDIARTSFTLGSFFSETLQLTFRSQGTPIGAPTGGLALTLVADDVSCVSTTPGVAIAQGQTSTTATVVYGGGASLPCTTFVRASSGSVDPDSVEITVVNDPQITTLARTVGSGLQNNSSFNLGLSNHGGVTVKVKSSDPSTMLVSPNASTAGTDSILITVPNGTQSVAYYVQGVELATGAPTVTVSAPGFTAAVNTITVVQPGITLGGVDPTLTTFDADDAFYASIGIPSGNTVSGQQIRAGGSPITVTFQTDNTSAGVLTDGVTPGASVTAQIGVQQANTPTSVAAGGVAHDPLAAGSATISASTPNFISQPNASVAVTVTAPQITTLARTVGSGLQNNSSFNLGASQHGGVTVTVTSSDPATMLVSPNASTPGTAFIEIVVPNGTQSVAYYVQGVELATGAPTVTVSAPSFTAAVNTITVVQPGITLGGVDPTLTTFDADDAFYASIGIPSGNTVSGQQIRAGGSPITVTFQTDNTSAGVLTDGVTPGASVTAQIGVQQANTPTSVAAGGVAHDPLAAGSATISASTPDFISQPNASVAVTVTAPQITTLARTVGSGLQNNSSFNLGASQHGGVTVTVTSSDPATMLVSPNASTPGTAFIEIVVPNGTQSVAYYVQGVELATGAPTVTVSAPSFTAAVNTITVVQPGITLGGVDPTLTTFDADDAFYASIGIPSGNTVSGQQIRAGGSPITVTFQTDNTSAGVLTDGVTPGASVTAQIGVQQANTPTSVAAGGVAHDPLGSGSATISASTPNFISQPNASVAVTVTAPQITTLARTVGSGLQNNSSFNLGASQHGGVTVTVTSSDPATMLVSPNASTPGTAFIEIVVPNGTQSVAYYVQGVELATGAPTVTVSAPGFLDGTGTITVVQPGITLGGVDPSLSASDPNDAFYAAIGIPSGNSVSGQQIRAGGSPITVTFQTDNTSAGVLTDGDTPGASVTAQIGVQQANTPTSVAAGGVAHDPLNAGSATISASTPNFITQPNASVAVTIIP